MFDKLENRPFNRDGQGDRGPRNDFRSGGGDRSRSSYGPPRSNGGDRSGGSSYGGNRGGGRGGYSSGGRPGGNSRFGGRSDSRGGSRGGSFGGPMRIEVLDNGLYFKIPAYATEGSAGADLYANADMEIQAGNVGLVPTGIFMAIPKGFEIQIRSRSGLAIKNQVIVLNAPGTIDSDYRGEIQVILMNHSKETFSIKKGDRIAQAVVNRYSRVEFETVKELSSTERNTGGFGSTGSRDENSQEDRSYAPRNDRKSLHIPLYKAADADETR